MCDSFGLFIDNEMPSRLVHFHILWHEKHLLLFQLFFPCLNIAILLRPSPIPILGPASKEKNRADDNQQATNTQ